jgi:hypothetical protein
VWVAVGGRCLFVTRHTVSLSYAFVSLSHCHTVSADVAIQDKKEKDEAGGVMETGGYGVGIKTGE